MVVKNAILRVSLRTGHATAKCPRCKTWPERRPGSGRRSFRRSGESPRFKKLSDAGRKTCRSAFLVPARRGIQWERRSRRRRRSAERLKQALNPWEAYQEIVRFAREGHSSIPP